VNNAMLFRVDDVIRRSSGTRMMFVFVFQNRFIQKCTAVVHQTDLSF
jgi:hypothetical protein